MTEPTIICPNCKTEIKLTESLAAPLIESTRRDFEKRLALKDTDIAKKEEALREREEAVSKAKQAINDQVAEKLLVERAKIVSEESKKAKLAQQSELDQKARELTELQEVLDQRNVKLAEAQQAQADLIRQKRELDDAKRELQLTVEKRVQDGLSATREQAKKEVEESLKFKVMEKEQTIASMQTQIEELKRRAEQGSQQLQGEVQELELEALLRTKFPRDTIEPVPKGEYGGDVLQHVNGPQDQICGTILWESKRTKNWSDTWLPKLRDDQRVAKAEVAIIISQVLPKGVESFDLVDGVWVTEPRCAIPVAISLRQYLIELSAARQAGEGQQTKMEMVYKYLTGPRFRLRVEAIVEKFSDMQADLDKERKAMTRLWAKREEQIRGVIESTAGMYGDLQGIAGRTFQEIDGLDIPLLDTPKTNSKTED